MSEREPLVAIVLAAGESKRFGASNKLLHRVDGVPLVNRVLAALSGRLISETIVVLGHESEQVAEVLVGENLRIVRNPDFHLGMGSSLRCAVSALKRPFPGGVLVCLADLPDLSRAHVRAVVERFWEASGDSIVVPVYEGKRGHPVCFPRQLLPELEELSGDEGARKIIESRKETVVFLNFDDDACIRDMDSI